ncbi:phage capsid protein [Caulobacter hibisci]|uniref:Capsid protein n=1 Tax=Caulobacter hibisci TaxID=2035993 RepID=A0ABS0SXX6_9CAUL|nr:phage capsid protein [Caulobacter hibisci]MBI1684458.1 hypothetical protein [Caulobacter hibisci]
MAENTELSQYVPGFKANLNLAPQQTDSRLLASVDSELNYSEPGTGFNADDVGISDPEDVNTRVPDTPDKFLDKTRRVGFFTTFQDSAWVDNVDKVAELVDPTNPTMQALMAGRWRKADAGIIAAMYGPAYEKADENAVPTAIAFPAAQIIAANDITFSHQDESVPNDASDYGMSIGKMIEANLLLDDSDIEGERFAAFGPAQVADLLRRVPATSKYYNEVQALSEGKIDKLLGFTIRRLPRKRLLLKDGTTNIRRVPFWIKPAVVYKGRSITEANIRPRADKSDTPQAFYKAQHGGSRRYDRGVVDVQCKETV